MSGRLAARPPRYVLVCARGLDPDMPSDPRRDRDYATLRETHPPRPGTQSNGSRVLRRAICYTRPVQKLSQRGIQRDTGGHAVALALAMQNIFSGNPGETMFTAADVGWAVGHSFGVYGPLIHEWQRFL